jgi:adenosine deaminase
MTTHEDFIKRAARHNVSYIEFTVGFDYIRDVSQFEWWAKRWQKNYNITARWNRAFLRVKDNLKIAHSFDVFASGYLKKPTEVVQGIDFIANETKFPALEHGQTLYLKALELDQQDTIVMHRTMHAGELGHPKNPRDAILLGAERLGHGVKLYDDVLTLEYVRTQSNTPIVINLSSNIQLGVAPSIETHPFLSFLRLGIPVSFSTDDEGMFVTDITHDILLAALHTDICYSELKQMTYNSIDNSFADNNLKNKLLIDLDQRYAKFENKWEEILSEDDIKRAVSGN